MKSQIVTFKCNLKNKAGQLISSTYNHDVLNSPQGSPAVLSGLARGMADLVQGERRSINLNANEAYGLYDPTQVIFFPRSRLPQDIRMWGTVSITGKSGRIRNYQVIEMSSEYATLDGNHPLAGQDLVFEIETIAVRDATAEEIGEAVNLSSERHLH